MLDNSQELKHLIVINT